MELSHEHVGPKILAKIQIYILTRAELLFTLCLEIPCTCYREGPREAIAHADGTAGRPRHHL